ncbi:MAG: ferrous iron transporter B [Phycisphaerales bacterium]|nr:ferrous iron transporter B [Phycisphaerales bacterium]
MNAALPEGPPAAALQRFALLGNPNTGKTTLFNRLCGLRHKTSNFPGTTQEARVGGLSLEAARNAELIDLPGVYSLELEQTEASICRAVLAGETAPRGEVVAAPDAVLIVIDATNLARNLTLVGEVLRRRLPTVVAVNMIDLAERRGVRVDRAALERLLGCRVVFTSARVGLGLAELREALPHARIPNRTPPAGDDAVTAWAESIAVEATAESGPIGADTLTDRLDRAFTHPVAGTAIFGLVMAGVFMLLFKLASYPMDWIDAIFAHAGGLIERTLPAGPLSDMLSQGVVGGVGATLVFLPQICLLFFAISLLEDTGYLARAAFVMDRVLRPFGLPGHAFVPLLSSHACALPGIMAARAIPDRHERLATILVAPFMTCSARLPVYVLVTTLVFRDRPLLAALAFVGCYALGIAAGVLSALLARRTILRGKGRPMAMELPSYKLPSLRTAFVTTFDRAWVFLRKAGTTILCICVVLWWLKAYPHAAPPPAAVDMQRQAESAPDAPSRDRLIAEADSIAAQHQRSQTYMARLGKFAQPVFAPMGLDWQLTVGVVASFAAREVFASTMAVITSGHEEAEGVGVMQAMQNARRADGVTPVFTIPVCWAILVYYVLAMQCLPTLAVTARESGSWKWAALQQVWMSGLAYAAAVLVFQILRGMGL